MGKFILLAVIFPLSQWFHPLHITICEIEYDDERKALEITQRVFLDDLELEVRNERADPDLDILQPDNGLTVDDLLKEYMKKHVKVSLEGKEQVYHYLGHEVEGDAVYCYFEIQKVRKVRSVGLFNDILINTHDDQVNLVHVEVDGEIKSMKLYSKVRSDEVVFE